ncbi:hypothetical protein CB1_000237008 [Camelus ferus]|nr:hypothetical protein CB1_000237008 [Camelus ferus]
MFWRLWLNSGAHPSVFLGAWQPGVFVLPGSELQLAQNQTGSVGLREPAAAGAESQRARTPEASFSLLYRSSRPSSNMLDGLKMEENFQSAIETSASFSSLLGRAVSPKSVCEGCQRVISDRFLLRLNDSFWHEQCVQCASCKEPLETTCFYRDKKLYCKYDYENRALMRSAEALTAQLGSPCARSSLGCVHWGRDRLGSEMALLLL